MGFRFQNLEIYQALREYTKEMFLVADRLPKQERYELTSQLRRAIVSVPLNFAEGAMRNSDKEFNRFILISIGSVAEIVAILDICYDLKYISSSVHQTHMLKSENIAKRLYGFRKKLDTK